MSRKHLQKWAQPQRPGKTKSDKIQQFVRLPFLPVGIETYGAYGPQAIKLIKQISKKIQEATGEKLSSFYLKQSISMAIQKGNAVCVRGCPQKTSLGLEGLFNFHVQEAEML
jgi:hypothetical protein